MTLWRITPAIWCPTGWRHEAIALLAAQFGDRVAEVVSAVTNPPSQDANERYREHVAANLLATRQPGSSRSQTSLTMALA